MTDVTKPYVQAMPGLSEAIMAKKTVSIDIEGTDTDFVTIMGHHLATSQQVALRQSRACYILSPSSIEDSAMVSAGVVTTPHQLLEEKLRDILNATKAKTTRIGLPIACSGHWYYLRLEIKQGHLVAVDIVDSLTQKNAFVLQSVRKALQNIGGGALSVNYQNRCVQKAGNTCMDWVAHFAMQDLGLDNAVTRAEDAKSLRSACVRRIRQKQKIRYRTLLNQLQQLQHFTSDPLIRNINFQVALDEKIARRFQQQLLSLSSGQEVDESLLFKRSKHDVLQYHASQLHLAADTHGHAPQNPSRCYASIKAVFFSHIQPTASSSANADAVDLTLEAKARIS